MFKIDHMSNVKAKSGASGQIDIVKKMPDLSNDPTVIKKNEMAKAFLAKHGLPKSFDKDRK